MCPIRWFRLTLVCVELLVQFFFELFEEVCLLSRYPIMCLCYRFPVEFCYLFVIQCSTLSEIERLWFWFLLVQWNYLWATWVDMVTNDMWWARFICLSMGIGTTNIKLFFLDVYVSWQMINSLNRQNEGILKFWNGLEWSPVRIGP